MHAIYLFMFQYISYVTLYYTQTINYNYIAS